MTNIVGLGAVQLLHSLLPALESSPNYAIKAIYLPAIGEFSDYKFSDPTTRVTHYKRTLPNSISRVLECTLPGRVFDGDGPLLVMGDLPLRGKKNQTLFVQSPLLTRSASTGRTFGAIKYWIARYLFRRNMGLVSAFIVQTLAMKSALIDTYPEVEGRIHVISQPPPSWLIGSKLQRTGRVSSTDRLRLFYPAAVYPHKNHRLLSKIAATDADAWLVSELVLTIPIEINPNPAVTWISCVGRLGRDAVMQAYADVDALLFLSLSESYGLPLVEAMWIGLPIICPDRPYARTLCGQEGIYFDPEDHASLQRAIAVLHTRLAQGWWPDWSDNLRNIPKNWEEVATQMLDVATTATRKAGTVDAIQ